MGIGSTDLCFPDVCTSCEQSVSSPCCLTPGERGPGAHWIGGWVGPRAGLDITRNRKLLPLFGLELRTFGHPVCSQLLCYAFQNHILQLTMWHYVEIEGIWRWITHRRTGFLDFVHSPEFNTTFRKLDLFPSSGERGRSQLCWIP
jgi:hypothetical protein